MPQILPILSLIVSAAGAGVGAYEANDASINQRAAQAANQKALLQQQQAQTNQANLTKQEAVLGAQGQAQEQTGGSLTDSGTASLTDLLAGYPGYQSGSSTNTISGGNAPATTSAIAPTSLTNGGSSGAGPSDSVTAILAALRNAGGSGPGSSTTSSISGGNWQFQPTAPQPWQELSNPVLS